MAAVAGRVRKRAEHDAGARAPPAKKARGDAAPTGGAGAAAAAAGGRADADAWAAAAIAQEREVRVAVKLTAPSGGVAVVPPRGAEGAESVEDPTPAWIETVAAGVECGDGGGGAWREVRWRVPVVAGAEGVARVNPKYVSDVRPALVDGIALFATGKNRLESALAAVHLLDRVACVVRMEGLDPADLRAYAAACLCIATKLNSTGDWAFLDAPIDADVAGRISAVCLLGTDREEGALPLAAVRARERAVSAALDGALLPAATLPALLATALEAALATPTVAPRAAAVRAHSRAYACVTAFCPGALVLRHTPSVLAAACVAQAAFAARCEVPAGALIAALPGLDVAAVPTAILDMCAEVHALEGRLLARKHGCEGCGLIRRVVRDEVVSFYRPSAGDCGCVRLVACEMPAVTGGAAVA